MKIDESPAPSETRKRPRQEETQPLPEAKKVKEVENKTETNEQ